MEERAEGLILRTRPLTETSLIVEWLTPDCGRLSTVAKGARRPKSAFAGKLDLFYQAAFSFQRSARSDLHALREVQVLDARAWLRTDFGLLHLAAYFTILIEKGTERETPLAEVYALAAEFLAQKVSPQSLPEALFLFEFRFLQINGFEPPIEHDLFARKFAELPMLPRAERNDLNRGLRAAVGSVLEVLPPQRQRAIKAMLK